MRSLRVLPVLFLLACVKLGPELTAERPTAEGGWSLSLHGSDPGTWELVLWHPERYRTHGRDPVRSVLLDEPTQPDVRSKTTTTFDGESTTVTTTRWQVSQARWRQGKPFQLRVKHGFPNMEPLSEYREILLEVQLGPTPGSAEGLSVKVLDLR